MRNIDILSTTFPQLYGHNIIMIVLEKNVHLLQYKRLCYLVDRYDDKTTTMMPFKRINLHVDTVKRRQGW